jgi:hypothetical protein
MAFEVSSVPLSLTMVFGLPLGEESIELASDPDARDRSVGDQRQALTGAIVHHDQDADATAIEELVGDEVERPAIVWPLWDEHRRPRAQGPLAATSSTDHEAFFAIQPEQAFVVHLEALSSEQNVQSPVAEAPALMG